MRATVASMAVTGVGYAVNVSSIASHAAQWLADYSGTFTACAAIMTFSLGVRAWFKKQKKD